MPKLGLKCLYLRGTLMGRKCAFLQCSAGRWPKLCPSDNHLSAQHGDKLLFSHFRMMSIVFLNRFLPGLNWVEVVDWRDKFV